MSNSGCYWHEVTFRIKMLCDNHEYKRINRLDSPIHSMIANEIIAPLIDKFQRDMQVWRFHRTFKPGKEFHPFRFKFYTSDGVEQKITQCVQATALYQELKGLGLLYLKPGEDVTCEKLSKEISVKDDNDPNWSEEMKEIWPYYIHGVSRAWLKIIQVITNKEKDLPRTSFREEIGFYERVNSDIECEWVKWGHHAMLHHLNAVFGYKHIDILCAQGDIINIEPVCVQKQNIPMPGMSMKISF
jgi:hypothetical protein